MNLYTEKKISKSQRKTRLLTFNCIKNNIHINIVKAVLYYLNYFLIQM